MERPCRHRAPRSGEPILCSLSLNLLALTVPPGYRPYPDFHCLGETDGTQSYPLDGDDGIWEHAWNLSRGCAFPYRLSGILLTLIYVRRSSMSALRSPLYVHVSPYTRLL